MSEQMNSTNVGTMSQGNMPFISISLLKKVTMTLYAPDGSSQSIPLSPNAKRVELLAYLAWSRGRKINRDKLIEEVFGYGRPDEEATREKLSDAFHGHIKLLRIDVRKAVQQLNTRLGRQVIQPDFDIFHQQYHRWSLSASCHVTDLDLIEQQYQIIQTAKKQGLMSYEISETVKHACDTLIANYAGDFLLEYASDAVIYELWAGNWMCEPITLYRDYYLQAIWYAAEYERQQGAKIAEQHTDRYQELSEHYGRAAQLYRLYAMYACNNPFDTKISVEASIHRPGERIVMSERALRRSIVLCGLMRSTHLIDEIYSDYERLMKRAVGESWEPDAETLKDLSAAREQTGEYRFTAQLNQKVSARN